jgi:hypothetical protein
MRVRSLPVGAPRLPAELVDQVLGNLDPYCHDKDTLLNCGLVSHTWLALSRSILFFSIFITLFRVAQTTPDCLKLFSVQQSDRMYAKSFSALTQLPNGRETTCPHF